MCVCVLLLRSNKGEYKERISSLICFQAFPLIKMRKHSRNIIALINLRYNARRKTEERNRARESETSLKNVDVKRGNL